MEWVLILGLVVWAVLLHTRVSGLEKRVAAQDILLKALRGAAPSAAGVTPAKATPAVAAAGPALREAAPAAERLAAARDLAMGVIVESTAPRRKAAPAPKDAPAPVARAAPGPRPDDQEGTIASWLSENGLAWVGGGALTLGGLLLVAYAAQRGFFTPGMRLAAAMALGFGLVGASEWIRRKGVGAGAQHRLAAAVTAGAGAATLYGAVLAAHAVYHYIDVPTATALLALVSLGLLGLSFLHGEPLGLLALGGGYAAPLIGLDPGWDQPILFAYLILVTVTGTAVSMRRDWTSAMTLAVAATGLWAVARAFSGDHIGPALLALTPAALALAWAASGRGRPARTDKGWVVSALAPLTSGFAMASIALLALWLTWPAGADLDVAAVAAVVLAAMAALAVRRRLAPGLLYAGAAASALIGFVLLLAHRFVLDGGWGSSMGSAATCVAVSLLAGAAGLFAVRRSEESNVVAVAAAVPPVVVIAALTAALPGDKIWTTALAATAAAALAGGAAYLSRSAKDVRRDLELGVWVAAAAMSLFIALQGGVHAHLLPIAYALAATGIALLARRLGWSATSGAAMAAGVLALAAMLSVAFATAVLEGDLSSMELAGVTVATAGLLAAGWTLVRRREDLLNAAEALGTAALVAGLIGAFWLLQQWSQGRGAPLDHLTEASLGTLLLLLAGLAVISPAGRGSGVIGRWRTHVFLIAGIAHAALFQVLSFNPLWDADSQARGWPIANTLLLAYLAPAAVLAFCRDPDPPGRRRLARTLCACRFRLRRSVAAHGDPPPVPRAGHGRRRPATSLERGRRLWARSPARGPGGAAVCGLARRARRPSAQPRPGPRPRPRRRLGQPRPFAIYLRRGGEPLVGADRGAAHAGSGRAAVRTLCGRRGGGGLARLAGRATGLDAAPVGRDGRRPGAALRADHALDPLVLPG